MITVTASGNFLKLILVFKGISGGRIKKRKPTFPTQISYKCQNNAWMDKDIMGKSIEEVFKPYIANALEDFVPMLILNFYTCHMMTSVMQKIQDLGVEVEHISGS